MGVGEFAQMAKAIKYKRGWKLEVEANWERGNDPLVYMRLQCHVPDAGDPDKYITVSLDEVISTTEIGLLTPEQALYRFRAFIEVMERHETREWFTYKGKRPFDPHANGDPADVVKAALAGETYGRG
jgi:hypothetical protein